jgi:UDP-N-acetylglucosamine 4,6-dehydratase
VRHILVTGGTGSFGSEFVDRALPFAETITIYSRDELKQYEMAARLKSDRVRFIIGDIRDKDRLVHATRGCTTVVHAAAMKQVPTCEANPSEAVSANIDGSRNVVAAALECGCFAIALSTDKAAVPANLYGATKLVSERLFLAAGFSVVRCGNIFGSRGSVVPLFLSQRASGEITVTDKRMTRYSLAPAEAVALVAQAVRERRGGRMYIPKMKSYLIMQLVEALAPDCRVIETGARAGERLHECLITEAEAVDATDCGGWYVVERGHGDGKVSAQYSDQNAQWLTVADIQEQAAHVR